MVRILVTGVGGPAGRSVATQLRQRRIDVVGVDLVPPDSDTTRVPAARDPEFVPRLTELAQRVDLVIPTVSEELVPLARLGDPKIVVGSPDAVAVADDKWLTFLHLFDVGVAVPRSCLGGDPVLQGIDLVSKPRVGRGGRGVEVHRGGALTTRDRTRIVQELLPGREYVVNLYLTGTPGRDVIEVLEKADGIRRTRAPDVAALAWSAAATIGLRGPVDVDVRRRADDQPVVLDVNARFGAHSAHTPALLDTLLAEHPC